MISTSTISVNLSFKILRSSAFYEAFCPNHSLQERISLLWVISRRHFPCTPPAWERPASRSCCTIKAWNYRFRFAPTTGNKLQLCAAMNSIRSRGQLLQHRKWINLQRAPSAVGSGRRGFQDWQSLARLSFLAPATRLLSAQAWEIRPSQKQLTQTRGPHLAGVKASSSPRTVSSSHWIDAN